MHSRGVHGSSVKSKIPRIIWLCSGFWLVDTTNFLSNVIHALIYFILSFYQFLGISSLHDITHALFYVVSAWPTIQMVLTNTKFHSSSTASSEMPYLCKCKIDFEFCLFRDIIYNLVSCYIICVCFKKFNLILVM